MRAVNKTKKNNRYWTSVAGVVIALIVSLVTSGISGILLLNDFMSEQHIVYVSSVIQLVSVFLGAFVACKRFGEKYIVAAAIVCVGYYSILIIANLLFFESSFVRLGVGLVMCVLGAVAASFLCSASKSKTKRKKRRL